MRRSCGSDPILFDRCHPLGGACQVGVAFPGRDAMPACSKGTDKLTIDPVRTLEKMLVTALSHIPKTQRLAV